MKGGQRWAQRPETRSKLSAAARATAAARIVPVKRELSAVDLASLPTGVTATVKLPEGGTAVAVHDGRGVWVMTSPVADVLESAELCALGVSRLWVP